MNSGETKTKWRVRPAPTGPYRSFFKRGWPLLEYEDGQLAAGITCADDYTPANARSGNHREPRVHIYDYSAGAQERRMCSLLKRFDKLAEAKAAAEAALKARPEFKPKFNKGISDVV